MALVVAELSRNLSRAPSDGEPTYCGAEMAAFSDLYRRAHGYLALATCLFGLTTNLFSIAVLTRKTMASPTNAIQTGLAVADVMVMLMYIPFALHYYVEAFGESRHTYAWAVYTLAFVHVTQVFHTVSIWLTVALAVWRYLAIGHPSLNREWCSMRNTFVSIVSVYIACPVICAPTYLTYAITPERGDQQRFVVNFSELSQRHDRLLEKLNFWVYSVHVKLLPCAILTIFSSCLISELYKAKRRKASLLRRSTAGAAKVSAAERHAVRTTRMLLAVLLLFLATELPQGVLSLLSGVLGKGFHDQCYNKLGDLMDILALVNSSMNFIFYCSMSSQFRMTFSSLFRPARWVPRPFKTAQTTEGTECTRV
ncbi:G-protein coupled receptor dmsr-1-like [Amphibalanus amphitrite]|uniref:G-protein coupled receptor dmsr-1-like n=1 Tax=Amphibalanus amphitrite TaxID=1232801 RepID=UPI001C9091BA|nr:G-protein coupled receptor dmsr-1-like [Amphibalanus amphitrite]